MNFFHAELIFIFTVETVELAPATFIHTFNRVFHRIFPVFFHEYFFIWKYNSYKRLTGAGKPCVYS